MPGKVMLLHDSETESASESNFLFSVVCLQKPSTNCAPVGRSVGKQVSPLGAAAFRELLSGPCLVTAQSPLSTRAHFTTGSLSAGPPGPGFSVPRMSLSFSASSQLLYLEVRSLLGFASVLRLGGDGGLTAEFSDLSGMGLSAKLCLPCATSVPVAASSFGWVPTLVPRWFQRIKFPALLELEVELGTVEVRGVALPLVRRFQKLACFQTLKRMAE